MDLLQSGNRISEIVGRHDLKSPALQRIAQHHPHQRIGDKEQNDGFWRLHRPLRNFMQ